MSHTEQTFLHSLLSFSFFSSLLPKRVERIDVNRRIIRFLVFFFCSYLGNILKHFQTFEMYVPNVESQANTQILQRIKPPPGTINVTTKYPEMLAILQPQQEKKPVIEAITDFFWKDGKKKKYVTPQVQAGKDTEKGSWADLFI